MTKADSKSPGPSRACLTQPLTSSIALFELFSLLGEMSNFRLHISLMGVCVMSADLLTSDFTPGEQVIYYLLGNIVYKIICKHSAFFGFYTLESRCKHQSQNKNNFKQVVKVEY